MAKLSDFNYPADPAGLILFSQALINALEIAAETMTDEQLRFVSDRADIAVDDWLGANAQWSGATEGLDAARSVLGQILRR